MTVKGDVGRIFRIHPNGFGELRVLPEFVEGSLSHQSTTLHAIVILSLNEAMSVLLHKTYGCPGCVIRGIRRAEHIGIEAGPLPHFADHPSSIAEWKTKRIVGVAGSDHHGDPKFCPVNRYFDKIPVLNLKSLGG